MSPLPSVYRNGYYDDRGFWNRTKFCFMDCRERCDCGPPGNRYYDPAHDKTKKENTDGNVAKNPAEAP